jgi:hypothetical protein
MSPRPAVGYRSHAAALRGRADDVGLDALPLTQRGSVAYLAGVWAPWRTAVRLPVDGDVSLLTSKNGLARVSADT